MTREAPLSYRPGKAREKRLKLYEEREGIGRSEAMHRLLDLGMEAAKVEDPDAPKPRKPRGPSSARWAI